MPAFKDKTHVGQSSCNMQGGRIPELQCPNGHPTDGTICCATSKSSFSPLASQGCRPLSYTRHWEGWTGFIQGTVPGMPRMATDLCAC